MQYYMDKYYRQEGSYMISWRASGAPIFTLAYRGKEVDALNAMKKKREKTCSKEETSENSRTVLFSHHTGECFVAKPCIHLQEGDPHMIVQVISDEYYLKEEAGFTPLNGNDIFQLTGGGYQKATGTNRLGVPVNGEEKIKVLSMKVIDVDVDEDQDARTRVALMQSIGRKWSFMIQQKHETDVSGHYYTDKRSVMWCGEVTKNQITQMLDLQKSLRHQMESVVLLTNDPYLQIHIPIILLNSNNNEGLGSSSSSSLCNVSPSLSSTSSSSPSLLNRRMSSLYLSSASSSTDSLRVSSSPSTTTSRKTITKKSSSSSSSPALRLLLQRSSPSPVAAAGARKQSWVLLNPQSSREVLPDFQHASLLSGGDRNIP